MVLRPPKVLVLGGNLNVILIYLFPSDKHIVFYLYLEKEGIIFVLAVNSQVEEGHILN